MPAGEALITKAPAAVGVSTDPFSVALPETMLKLTARPEEAVALRVMGAPPSVKSCRAPKEMVWLNKVVEVLRQPFVNINNQRILFLLVEVFRLVKGSL